MGFRVSEHEQIIFFFGTRLLLYIAMGFILMSVVRVSLFQYIPVDFMFILHFFHSGVQALFWTFSHYHNINLTENHAALISQSARARSVVYLSYGPTMCFG